MRERRTYGERRTERKRHTGTGGKPFRRPRRIRARHDHRPDGNPAVELHGRHRAHRLRKLRRHAWLGPDLHGRRHPAADVPAPGPDSRVPQEIPDYRRPVVRILRIVDIPLAGSGLYRRILGGSEPSQLSVAHDDGAAVGGRIPSQARGRQGAAGRDRGHCRRGVGGRR